jgi:hypothetical protein
MEKVTYEVLETKRKNKSNYEGKKEKQREMSQKWN